MGAGAGAVKPEADGNEARLDGTNEALGARDDADALEMCVDRAAPPVGCGAAEEDCGRAEVVGRQLPWKRD